SGSASGQGPPPARVALADARTQAPRALVAGLDAETARHRLPALVTVRLPALDHSAAGPPGHPGQGAGVVEVAAGSALAEQLLHERPRRVEITHQFVDEGV